MRLNDAFPSKYLKAEDLEEGDLVVTIRDAQFEEFTDQRTKRPDNKPVLYFEGDTKPLVLNKTNYKTISQMLKSDDTDDWMGRSVSLYATEVESFGEVTLGIRVRVKAPVKAAAKAQAAPAKAQFGVKAIKPQPPPEEIELSVPDEDQIPF